jgi:hypothetical protein
MDYYPTPKYYRCSPGLPSAVQLKVRARPELDARILGYLRVNFLIKVKPKCMAELHDDDGQSTDWTWYVVACCVNQVVGKSGDWVMVVYKGSEHSWMLTRNRRSRQLLVPEANQVFIAKAMEAGASPFECKVCPAYRR